MFVGEYNHTFDAKGRIFIPVKFREELGQHIYLSRGFDKCITVYSEEAWEQFSQKMISLPDIDSLEAKRFIFRKTEDVVVDGSGRVLVSAKLRAHAEITKEVVIIGVGDKVEMWSEENFEREVEGENVEALKAQLKRYGL